MSLKDFEEDLNEEMEDITETKIVFKDNLPKSELKISGEELQSLYKSFDIDSNQLNQKYSLWRLQVIHIRGVQDMSSEDVLKYFEDFDPISIEWVNDLSCNVVFNEPKAAAIAMKSLTTALVVKMSKHAVNNDVDIEVIDSDSLSVPIPPQFIWRLGISCDKSKALLLRFATDKDKKVTGSRPISQYYVKYGVPNDNSDKMATNERKRSHNLREDSPENNTTSQMQTKRFRMRADDEQQLIQNRKTAKMRINRNDGHRPRKSIWDRLDNDSFGNYCAVDNDLLEIAFDNKTNSRKTVWKESPLRSTVSMISSHKNNDKNDLRSKLKQKSL